MMADVRSAFVLRKYHEDICREMKAMADAEIAELREILAGQEKVIVRLVMQLQGETAVIPMMGKVT